MGSNKMNQTNIVLLFKNHLWENLARLYSSNDIVKILSFKESLILAYQLLYNDSWDEDLQEYAIKLLYEIRNNHSQDWDKSWEYDALIGLACDIRYKHEERYLAYKKAIEKCNDPPPRLLIEFARCCVCPGHPPITYDEAIELTMKALRDAQYSDGISLLCNLYSLKNDEINKEYWSKVLKNINDNGKKINSPSMEPKFLVDEYLKNLKKLN